LPVIGADGSTVPPHGRFSAARTRLAASALGPVVAWFSYCQVAAGFALGVEFGAGISRHFFVYRRNKLRDENYVWKNVGSTHPR
jgi:hypothetical protein